MLFREYTHVFFLSGFFEWLLKTREEYDFLSSSPLKGTVTRREYETCDCVHIYVQEFHLWVVIV
jgi:hypothetical protein